MNALIAWMVATMLTMAPVGRQTFESARETADEGRARYEQIARDVVAVAYDPDEAPLFGGPDGRKLSALTALAVAYHESGWRKDVDSGTGTHARGDGGTSWCLMQLHIGKSVTAEGWTGPQLVEDRRKCLRAGYHLLQRSYSSCKARAKEDRLSQYTGGQCLDGSDSSKDRVLTARKLAHLAPRVSDGEIFLDLKE